MTNFCSNNLIIYYNDEIQTQRFKKTVLLLFSSFSNLDCDEFLPCFNGVVLYLAVESVTLDVVALLLKPLLNTVDELINDNLVFIDIASVLGRETICDDEVRSVRKELATDDLVVNIWSLVVLVDAGFTVVDVNLVGAVVL